MQDFLSKLIGRRIDLYCGGSASIRGEVIKVEDGVLQLKDVDDKMCYVAIEKITIVWDAPDEEHHAGFVSKI